jgi:hypothetical protein
MDREVIGERVYGDICAFGIFGTFCVEDAFGFSHVIITCRFFGETQKLGSLSLMTFFVRQCFCTLDRSYQLGRVQNRNRCEWLP